jgi:hypothetical protein
MVPRSYEKDGQQMSYTLITRNGTIMQFHIKAVVDLYQSLNGGVVITQQILEQETVDKVVKA